MNTDEVLGIFREAGAVLEGHVSMKKSEGRVLPLRQETKKESVS